MRGSGTSEVGKVVTPARGHGGAWWSSFAEWRAWMDRKDAFDVLAAVGRNAFWLRAAYIDFYDYGLHVGQRIFVHHPFAASLYPELRPGACVITGLERSPYGVCVNGRRLPLLEFAGAVRAGVITDPPEGP